MIKKKILFVGMPFSIHTVRWLNQLHGFEIYLFPSIKYLDLNKEINNSVVYLSDIYNILNYEEVNKKNIKPINSILGHIRFRNKKINRLFGSLMRFMGVDTDLKYDLKYIIRKIRPEIIHTFETQNAGYLVSDIWNELEFKPIWFHTIWGSDLYFFSNFEEHKLKITSTFLHVSKLIVEGKRDFDLARSLGYQGQIVQLQATGGISLNEINKTVVPPSKRTILTMRGTQDLVRRGLLTLSAFEFCDIDWGKYELHLYSVTEDVKMAARISQKKKGLNLFIHEKMSRNNFLDLLRISKIHVSISISDGMPNSLIESMAVGAFPIQSVNSCGDDIISNQFNGMIVSDSDPCLIANAIYTVLNNDELVDKAASYNKEFISKYYSDKYINPKIEQLYINI